MEKFLENTTFHCFVYLKSKPIRTKVVWSILLISVLAIAGYSTTDIILNYFQYNSYIIRRENRTSEIPYVPNILLCFNDQIRLVETLLMAYPEYRIQIDRLTKALNTTDGIIDFESLSLNADIRSLITEVASTNGTFNKLFDISFINSIIKEFDKRKYVYQCSIINFQTAYNCTTYIKYVFTIHGVCVMIDLKDKRTFINDYWKIQSTDVPPFDDYALNLEFRILNYKMYSPVYFILSTNEFFPSNQTIYFPTKRHFLKSSYLIDYNIDIERVRYLDFFEGKICKTNIDKKYFEDSEQECHFECLQMLINRIIQCSFLVGQTGYSRLCSIIDTPIIEYVIRNYDKLREKSGLCEPCLSDCQYTKYISRLISFQLDFIDDLLGQLIYINKLEYFDLELRFSFKYIENIYVPLTDLSELQNTLNGLWSLFLGISLLSLWELAELAYTLTLEPFIRYLFENTHIKNFSLESPFRKLQKLIEFIFFDTNMHGFKHIINPSNTISSRFRWMIVTSVSIYGLYIAASNCYEFYLQYNSNMLKTSLNIRSSEFIDRNVSVYLCMRLKDTIYPNYLGLYEDAKVIYSMSKDHKQNLKNYIDLLNSSNISVSQFDHLNEADALELYNRIFSIPDFSDLLHSDYMGYDLNFTYEFIGFKLCLEWYESDYANLLEGSMRHIRINNLSGLIYLSVFDKNDFHLSETSVLKLYHDEPIIDLRLKLKEISYLNEPFEPRCIDSDEYSQYDCHLKCLNKIFLNDFGCKLIYSNDFDNNYFCHPLLIPLLEHHMAFNNFKERQECKMCLQPCKAAYYELITRYAFKSSLSTDGYFVNILLEVSYEHIEQVPLVSFYATIILICSYLSLYLGGSLLTVLQILFQAFLNIFKSEKAERTWLDFKVLNIIGTMSTFHCIKYISFLQEKNFFKQLFWIIVIILTSLLNAYYFTLQIHNYSNELKISQLRPAKEIEFVPTLSICKRKSFYIDSKFIESNGLLGETLAIVNRKMREYLYCESFGVTCTNNLKEINNKYLDVIKEFDQMANFTDIKSIKWADELHKEINWINYTKTVIEFNGTEFKISEIYNNTRITYSTHTNEFYVAICVDINLSQILNANKIQPTKRPLTITSNEVIKIKLSDETIDSYQLYYDSVLLQIQNSRSENFHFEINKQTHLKNHVHHDTTCVFKNVIYDYDDKTLFFCNEDFMNEFVDTFQCTPFYRLNQKSVIEPCSILLMPVINILFNSINNSYYQCEECRFHNNIEANFIDYTENNNSSWHYYILDRNYVEFYNEIKIKNTDLFRLLTDLANFSNITLGISLLTFVELFYLILFNIVHNNKVSPLHS